MPLLPKNDNPIALVAVGAIPVLVLAATILFQRKQKSTSKTTKTKDTWESHVNPEHGPLREIWPQTLYVLEAPGCSQGPPVRNMAIYRIPNSSRLVVFNGVAVTEPTVQEILALGTPTVLVVPNSMHREDAAVWKDRFPDLTVVCPNAALEAARQVVPVNMTTQELIKLPEWSQWLDAKEIAGWAPFETILMCELEDDAATDGKKAMLVADLLFTLPLNKDAGMLEKIITWIFDSSVDEPPNKDTLVIPKVSRVARLFGILDWKAAEQWYRTFAAESGQRIAAIVVGHGPPVVEIDASKGCSEALNGVADQLIKPRW